MLEIILENFTMKFKIFFSFFSAYKKEQLLRILTEKLHNRFAIIIRTIQIVFLVKILEFHSKNSGLMMKSLQNLTSFDIIF